MNLTVVQDEIEGQQRGGDAVRDRAHILIRRAEHARFGIHADGPDLRIVAGLGERNHVQLGPGLPRIRVHPFERGDKAEFLFLRGHKLSKITNARGDLAQRRGCTLLTVRFFRRSQGCPVHTRSLLAFRLAFWMSLSLFGYSAYSGVRYVRSRHRPQRAPDR